MLALLLWIIVRYNKRANPVPAKWSHNMVVEVLWTIVPVLILVVIAIPSFPSSCRRTTCPEADMTIKATGNHVVLGLRISRPIPVTIPASNMLPKDEAKAKHVPYLLAVDEPMVVP